MATKVETVWQRFGSLINTGMIVLAACALIWNGGREAEKRDQADKDNARDILRVSETITRDNQAKWDTHAELHKSRQTEISAVNARFDERFKNVENDLRRINSVTENLTYRVTTAENNLDGLSNAIKEIQNLLAQQSGDLREIKVILQGREKTK
ncbi:hypothetical protein KIP58_21650 [Xanthomonas campestris pv. campestris]|nr:hypothetical protein [Xanthomonas campestris]MCF8861596.1 hypothetical protein [Xanthomonas campestris pv. campestris]